MKIVKMERDSRQWLIGIDIQKGPGWDRLWIYVLCWCWTLDTTTR